MFQQQAILTTITDRQAILTTITDRSHMMVTTEKVSDEIRDDWRKYAERIRNV